MKINPTPWPAVRWMAAAAIYIFTVAVATDMVRMRQERIDELESGLRQMKSVVDRIAVTTDQNIKGIQQAVLLLEDTEQIQQKNLEQIEAHGRLMDVVNQAKLREARRMLDEAQGK